MISDEQLLEFHRRSRDAVRAVLDNITEEVLRERDPEREFSIAEEVGHLVAAEHFFRTHEFGIDPSFAHMDRTKGQQASLRELLDRLSQIEQDWSQLLRDNPDVEEMRVALARMALHTLYHLARIVDRRVRMEPQFRLPNWSQRGSWEFAIEPLLQALRGNKTEPSASPG